MSSIFRKVGVFCSFLSISSINVFFSAGVDKTISWVFFLKRYFVVRYPPLFEKLVFFALPYLFDERFFSTGVNKTISFIFEALFCCKVSTICSKSWCFLLFLISLRNIFFRREWIRRLMLFLKRYFGARYPPFVRKAGVFCSFVSLW